MATYVLVHGTGCGGWIWSRLAPLLRAEGHEVHAPTLTGLGDRAHLLHCGVSLTTHIDDIANLLVFEDLFDVVLVGHSYGGMVVTGVAARRPERIAHLVYLDAYVPEAGQTELDLWPATMRAEIEEDEAARGGLRQPPSLDFFGITDPEMAAWMTARLTPHPLSTYTEPVPFGDRSAPTCRVRSSFARLARPLRSSHRSQRVRELMDGLCMNCRPDIARC